MILQAESSFTLYSRSLQNKTVSKSPVLHDRLSLTERIANSLHFEYPFTRIQTSKNTSMTAAKRLIVAYVEDGPEEMSIHPKVFEWTDKRRKLNPVGL